MTKPKETSTDKAVDILVRWQDAENRTIAQTTSIIAKSKNPLVKLIMEVIRHDSVMHHRVQQFIVDSLTTKAITLTPEELAEVWDLVEEHVKMERETIGYGEELKKVCKLFVQSQLVSYLLTDEEKHDKMLGQLEQFKNKMYPYA
ncbi:MAG: hypothetical protein ACOY3Y_18725 [Acidobacteriota bacterium]